MAPLAIFVFTVGALLGLCDGKCLVLIPGSLLLIIWSLVSGLASADGPLSIACVSILGLSCLQFGYLLGILILSHLEDSRRDNASRYSRVESLQPPA
jgi:hypothetical protein